MGRCFEQKDVFPVIAESIRGLQKTDFASHEAIVQALLTHPRGKTLVDAAHQKCPHLLLHRLASNMVEFFSKNFADTEYYLQFERKRVRDNDPWAYKPLAPPKGSSPHQPEPPLRQQVEIVAVERTTAYFSGLGYRVDSVERDNVGWDLNATSVKGELKLEVKGLSGPAVVVELTPNEYRAMQQHRDSYRVCVVSKALTAPCLEVFAYSPEAVQWESPAGRILVVEEIIAARCSAT